MTTAIEAPRRNGLVFAEVPPEVQAAAEAFVAADRGLYLDRLAMRRDATDETRDRVVEAVGQYDDAKRHAERVLEEAQGPAARMYAYYPVAGRLVGFAKIDGCGLTLVAKADRCNLKDKGR